MTRRERIRLVALARYFWNEKVKAEKWLKKNWHRCGHSQTKDALGDEGWAHGHALGGEANAYYEASLKLIKLINSFELEKRKNEENE